MILAAASNVSDGLGLVVMVLAATTAMLMLLRRHQFRRVTGRDVAREQIARLRDQKHVRDSMDELLLQLEQLAREVNAQLDTKFIRLETVIRDADERIRRIEVLTGRRSLDTDDAPATTGPADEAASRDLSAAVAPSAPASPPAPAVESAASLSPRPLTDEQRRVYAMHDAGSTPVEVAEKLGLPLGEVEVMLQLRRF